MQSKCLVFTYPGGVTRAFGLDCNVRLIQLWPGETMGEFLASSNAWRRVRWEGEEQRSSPWWKDLSDEERARKRLLIQWQRVEAVLGRKAGPEEMELILRHALAVKRSGAEFVRFLRKEVQELEKKPAAQAQDALAADIFA